MCLTSLKKYPAAKPRKINKESCPALFFFNNGKARVNAIMAIAKKEKYNQFMFWLFQGFLKGSWFISLSAIYLWNNLSEGHRLMTWSLFRRLGNDSLPPAKRPQADSVELFHEAGMVLPPFLGDGPWAPLFGCEVKHTQCNQVTLPWRPG